VPHPRVPRNANKLVTLKTGDSTIFL
jgi:hypothetical protein